MPPCLGEETCTAEEGDILLDQVRRPLKRSEKLEYLMGIIVLQET